METQELLTKGIGTIEHQKLKPAKVRISAVAFQTKTKDGTDMKTPLCQIKCKHPDKDELIDFTKIKMLKNDKVQVVSLWANLDEEGNLQKSSAVAHLLNHTGSATLQDLYTKEIDTITESDTSPYLCLKAY